MIKLGLSGRATAAIVIVVAAIIGGVLPVLFGPLKFYEFNFLSSGYPLVIYSVYVIAAWLINANIYWGPVVSEAGNNVRVFDITLGVITGSVGMYMAVSYWVGVWTD